MKKSPKGPWLIILIALLLVAVILILGNQSFKATEKATFDVGVVRKYSKGRYGRHGVEWFAYVLLGPIRSPLHQIYEEYRLRFGIESTCRLMNKVRVRTSSRSPGLRLLLVGIGVTLVNIWVFLKWANLGWPRRGGRDVWAELFPLTMFKQFFIEAVKPSMVLCNPCRCPEGLLQRPEHKLSQVLTMSQ